MLLGTGGFLVEGWDNSGDWMLTCEYSLQGLDGEGITILPSTNTGGIQNGQKGFLLCNYGQGFGLSSGYTSGGNTYRISTSRISGWQTLKMIKNGDNFNVTTYNSTFTIYNDIIGSTNKCDRCVIGLDRWNQGTVKIKNIKVISL